MQAPSRRREAYVAELGLCALQSTDTDLFMSECVKNVAGILGATHVAYMELAGEDMISLRAAVGWDQAYLGRVVPIDKCGQMGYALRTKETVICEDMRYETRFQPHEIVFQLGLLSGVTSIAWDGDRPIGIFAAHAQAAQKFSPQDADFLQSVTNVLASKLLRDRALQDLAEREERFRTLCDAVPIVVWSSDTTGYIDFYNKEMSKYTDLPMNEMSERRAEFLHPDDIAHVETVWGTGLQTGERFEVEYRWRKSPAHPYRWMRSVGVPLRDSAGNVTRWIGTSADIDAEKRYAETLELHVNERTQELSKVCNELEQEMRQRNEIANELQQLTYVVSHELQEPLRIIRSQLGLLSVRYKGNLGSDADEFITSSTQAASSIARMIDDLWTYARVGKQLGDVRPVDMTALSERVTTELRPQIEECGAVIQFSDLPVINVNEQQWLYLIRELLTNSMKFRSERPPHITISARKDEAEWLFSVTDNGIGFDMVDSAQIFQMFKRLDPKRAEGTGMGLSICRRIVEAHKGRLWPASQAGTGTTMLFTLPA